MIQCIACHYQALGPIDLRGHLMARHGFNPEQAGLEAARVAAGLPEVNLDPLAILKEILTDSVNQLEVTKGGYYIYRFDLATMHRIADALGIPQTEPKSAMAFYSLAELPTLIQPD